MATKKKAGKKAKGQEREQVAAAVGQRLMAQFKDELSIIKNPGNTKQNIWSTLSEIQQAEILDRFGRRIEHELRIGYDAILANGFPAVTATLAKVAFGTKGIQGNLEISRASAHRHELADFSGKQVLVILTDELDEYLESMKEVKPDRDQGELGLESPPDDQAEEDPRTMEELQKHADDLAKQLGEDDIEWADRSREALLDYIGWAEQQLAEKAEAQG